VTSLKQNFATNLRLLCGRHRSVSEVCRRLGINRQQFNKYLAGTSLPSPATLGRICAFFAIDQGDILVAPDEFARLAGARPPEQGPVPPPLFAPTVDRIVTHFPESSRKLERYVGYYFGYYCTPAYPRKVIKSLSRICRSGDHFYDRTIERLVDKRRPHARFSVCKYTGSVVHTEDRIYIAHANLFLNQTMSLVVFYPSYRATLQYLSGVCVSVSSGPGRQPFASRVVYQYLGATIDRRQALAACGLYPIDSAEIGEEIRLRVRNAVPPGESSLRALEY
jgi:transcriptional regulator with XRE-family HTH domain